MSGTAIAVGVSGTKRRCSLPMAVFLAIACVSFSSGCEASSATPSTGTTSVDAATFEIDAGVIFSDRECYLVLPLSRFGLSSSEGVESVVSSCECVNPSLVWYSDSSTTTAKGVLLEFIPDESTSNPGPQSMRLAVEVKLTMIGADPRVVKVCFLHTNRSGSS